MLDDMLFLAQMETNSLTITKEALDIGPFIQAIVDEFQAIHGETYTVYFDGDITDRVIMDPRPLRQIAANLISNAIKYSPPGGEVRVALENHEDYCRLTVQDQGIGIPEADQPRLFSAFQRGSNVSGVLGTGLGLAIIKQAVELLGGSIRLASQVGAGTTMTVDLPIETQRE
jgi:signal transduction histidine kinase